MARGGGDLPSFSPVFKEQHPLGEGSPCHPRLLPAEPPSATRTREHPEVCQTTLCHLHDRKHDNEQQTWVGPRGRPGDRPSPCRRPLTAQGNHGLAASLPDPPAPSPVPLVPGRRPSTVRSPTRRREQRPQPLSATRSLQN